MSDAPGFGAASNLGPEPGRRFWARASAPVTAAGASRPEDLFISVMAAPPRKLTVSRACFVADTLGAAGGLRSAIQPLERCGDAASAGKAICENSS